MQEQTFQTAEFTVANRPVMLIYAAYSAVATDATASQSLTWFKQFFPQHEVAIVALDILHKPVFVGAKEIAEAFQGRSLTDIRWVPRILTIRPTSA